MRPVGSDTRPSVSSRSQVQRLHTPVARDPLEHPGGRLRLVAVTNASVPSRPMVKVATPNTGCIAGDSETGTASPVIVRPRSSNGAAHNNQSRAKTTCPDGEIRGLLPLCRVRSTLRSNDTIAIWPVPVSGGPSHSVNNTPPPPGRTAGETCILPAFGLVSGCGVPPDAETRISPATDEKTMVSSGPQSAPAIGPWYSAVGVPPPAGIFQSPSRLPMRSCVRPRRKQRRTRRAPPGWGRAPTDRVFAGTRPSCRDPRYRTGNRRKR